MVPITKITDPLVDKKSEENNKFGPKMSNTLKCAKYIANKYQILVRKFGRDKGIVKKKYK